MIYSDVCSSRYKNEKHPHRVGDRKTGAYQEVESSHYERVLMPMILTDHA